MGLPLWFQDLADAISIFVKILFDFKKKHISLSKGKPENSFTITKNQEFELINSCHFFKKKDFSENPVNLDMGI